MKIYENLSDLIGKTPLFHMKNYEKSKNMGAVLLAKLESFNPAGSVKDRVALKMLDEAEKNGLIKPGAVIIEPTSGNTGIGLAAVGASRGYRVVLTMPDTMSEERRNLLKAYGAEVVLTEGSKGMTGAIEKAKEMAAAIENSYIPGQFDNPYNPAAHYETTGPEIWEDTDGEVDIFVAGVGTGGTITGTAEYLKSKNPDIKIIAVEPADSPVLSGGEANAHKIQGIGANFIPKVLNTKIYDEIISVEINDVYTVGKEIAGIEGILIGLSSAAAIVAATEIGCRLENTGKKIVVLLPDGGEKYMSTPMFF